MVINLSEIANTIAAGCVGEHPLARRVGYTLAMRRWRADKRKATANKDYFWEDILDREWEMIQGIY